MYCRTSTQLIPLPAFRSTDRRPISVYRGDFARQAAPLAVTLLALCIALSGLVAERRRTADLERQLQHEQAASATAQQRLRTDAADAAARSAALEDDVRAMEVETEHLYTLVRAIQVLGEQLRSRVGLPGPPIEPLPDLPPRATAAAGPVHDALVAGGGGDGTDAGAGWDGATLPLAAERLALLPPDTGPWPATLIGEPRPLPPAARVAVVSDAVAKQWDAWQELSQSVDTALSQRGRASRPSVRPVIGPISSGFGRRAGFWGALAYHTGIDIAVPIGTALVATADGTVTFAGVLPDFGQAVEIQHAGGLLTLYGHLSAIRVRTGQVVWQGQVIALSGNSGISTGPHLHYEVRLNGAAVDPSRYW